MTDDTFHSPAVHTPTPEEPKRCVMCEKLGGIFGILFGSILLLISIDLLTGGAISGLLGRTVDDDES